MTSPFAAPEHTLPQDSNNTAAPEGDRAIKTALDCGPLTLARETRAQAEAARRRAASQQDPLDALYRPLGNKDVRCVLDQH